MIYLHARHGQLAVQGHQQNQKLHQLKRLQAAHFYVHVPIALISPMP